MQVNKWWFTMLWQDPTRGWVISPLHADWAAAAGGLFSKGYDTLDEAEADWLQTSATSSLGFQKDRQSTFYLDVVYAPSRPDYSRFARPRIVFYELDLET